MSRSVGVIGVGHAVPETVVSNEDLVARGIDTSDEWIQTRTGIQSRRVVDANTQTSDLAVLAAKQAIQRAGIAAAEIELVIVATSTPDYNGFPSTACLVQKKLGLGPVPAFDLSAACTGFNYALTTAKQFIANGKHQKVLVIGADCLSQVVNWKDRSTSILFGDGAGAVILSECEKDYGLLCSDIFANGDHFDILKVQPDERESFYDSTHTKQEPTIQMDGKSVFKVAVDTISPALEKAVKKVGLSTSDIDYLILHQANLRIIEAVRKRIELPKEKVISNLQKFGNTSAASIPIALSETVEKGLLKRDDILVLLGFGAGFTWGVSVLRWQ